MMPLNFRSSGLSRNCGGVSGTGSTSSSSLTFMRHLDFSSELLVGETAAYNLAHRADKSVTVGHVSIVVAADFFVQVAVRWKGSTET